ncbi:catalase 1 [Recurvomyces mirabilis]|nr:catalase 1 [Recurvomyces mirabilis]
MRDCFVKFHFTPHLTVHSFVWDEVLKLAGQDPDFHREGGLYEGIDNGVYPNGYEFGVQVVPEADEEEFEFDILDATKLWPEELVPIECFAEMELNRNVDEYFTQIEQVAFCTGHILSQLGNNWQELPVNRPVCPVMNNNRGGQLCHTIIKGTVNYWPNRLPPATAQEGGHVDYAAKVAGMKQRVRSRTFPEQLDHAQLFYNSLSTPEQSHIAAALAFELDHCEDPVVYEAMTKRLSEIDLELASQVSHLAGAPVSQEAGRENNGKKVKGILQTEAIAPGIKRSNYCYSPRGSNHRGWLPYNGRLLESSAI